MSNELVRMNRGDEVVDVRPDWVEQWKGWGWSLPDGADDNLLTDDQLRAAIKELTGKAPKAKTPRAKLIAQHAELTAGLPDGDQALANKTKLDEVAASGLTRREILADLTAWGVDHDENDSTEDLGALRDLKRDERDAADQSNQA